MALQIKAGEPAAKHHAADASLQKIKALGGVGKVNFLFYGRDEDSGLVGAINVSTVEMRTYLLRAIVTMESSVATPVLRHTNSRTIASLQGQTPPS